MSKLQSKFLLVCLPLLILPILLVGWISLGYLKNELFQSTKQRIETDLDNTFLHVKKFLDSAQSNLDLLSRNDLFVHYLLSSEETRYEIIQPSLLNLMREYSRAFPDYFEIRIILPDGYEDTRYVSKEIENKTEEEFETSVIKKIFESDSVFSMEPFWNQDTERMDFLIAKKIMMKDKPIDPVYAKENFYGVLAFTIEQEFFKKIMKNRRKTSDGIIFFTDNSNRPVFYPIRWSNFFRSQKELTFAPSADFNGSEIVFMNKPYIFRDKEIYKNLRVAAAYPKQLVVASEKKLRFFVALITLLTSAFISVALYIFFNRVVLNPIDTLSLATEQIKLGNYKINLQSKSRDEIGELTRSFNNMVKEVQSANDHLESEVKIRTKKLEEKNIELERKNEDHKNLVRILCHDLNNALGVVISSAFVAVKNKSSEKSDKLWSRVFKAANLQKEIIDSVKQMEAVKSGKIEVELEEVDLLGIIQKAKFVFKDKLAEKELTLNVIGCEGVSVLAEPSSLGNNVINNLLSNAIKFSYLGDEILIKAERCSNNLVKLSISDKGLGMPKGILKNLFKQDKKTSRLGTAGEGGTGFGMPLVKTFLNHYKATISVESRCVDEYPNDHGTTFTITFYDGNEEVKKAV